MDNGIMKGGELSSKTPSDVTMAVDPGWYEQKRRDERLCRRGECHDCDQKRTYYWQHDLGEKWKYDDFSSTYTYQWPRQYGKSMTMIDMVEAVYSITNNKENDMYDNSSNAVADTKLMKGLKKLDLDDETQLLLDAKVVDDKGDLTKTGFAFVLTVLFKENKSLIVDKLKAIKSAEAKSKAAPAAEYEKALEAGKASA